MATIGLQQDFKEFLQLLNDHGVEHLLIGDYAVDFHGHERTTGDMDVWVARNSENAKRLAKVLLAFGVSKKNTREELFFNDKKVIQIGVPPVRIDILMSISGLDFDDCYARRVVDQFDGVTTNFLSLEDLKTNKRASDRLKDLNDLENLP